MDRGRVVLSEHRGGEESMMDVAERYLNELASRCMIEIEMDEVLLDSIAKRCRLHDLMRELCLTKGEEEEFWKVIDINNQDFLATDLSSQSHDYGRRFHMHTKVESWPTNEILDKVFEKVQGEPIRTLYVVSNFILYSCLRVELRRLKKLKLLRVLHLEGCELESSEGISQLIYLRYLRLSYSRAKELPASISNLSYLHTLDLRKCPSIYLPNIFWKMKRLKHFYLPESGYEVSEILEFRDMSELETLWAFDCRPNTPVHLSGLTNLQNIYGKIDADAFSDQMEDEIHSWKKIKWLHIHMSGSGNSDNSGSGSGLLRKLLSCQNLNALQIDDIPIGKFPPYETDFWPNLSALFLQKTKMEEDPMQFLKNLPNLRRLGLEDAFVEKEMFCDATAFPQLRAPDLYSLPNLMKWRVDEGAMPNLFNLAICRCSKLETITDGLNLSALKEFEIYEMPKEFKRKYKMLHEQA